MGTKSTQSQRSETLAVRASSLSKRFDSGRILAVNDVSLTVETGEVVALLGRNGAGKTTLLDMVLGLSDPTEGEVEIYGHSPKTSVRQGKVGALLQTGGLLPDLTVGETIKMISAVTKDPLDEAEVIRIAGLESKVDRKVSRCSGGEQQRVKFALALLPDPDLLVLDEPTAGMDVGARREFWARMHDRAGSGKTIIFATHYLEEAEHFADRIVLIDDGAVIADGPTPEIVDMAGFTHVTVTWPATSEDLEAVAQSPDVADGNNYELHGDKVSWRTSDPDSLARYLLTRTKARDLLIVPATLEEAFIELTETEDQQEVQA